jgi:hypothetical protein
LIKGLKSIALFLGCHSIPHEYLEMTTPASIAALIFATLGILATLLTITIFISHNGTPVVKSTTRELSYIILGGIIACYASSFAILAKPSFLSCFITRIAPPISFAIIYSALLTKTNRIARILAGSKKRILTKKPRFLSTFSQVGATLNHFLNFCLGCYHMGLGCNTMVIIISSI